ncbi:MAG: SET domain-containing protein-lysine N-methyltransferase [Verrucomicrobia bacterium]|nr:SET domain-containing protein-lysine N-methyltransferase [Verrucomicrobiota bacterium]
MEKEYFEIKDSPIHGKGCFAVKSIAKGTRIVEYTGVKITKRESEKRCMENNEYIFTLDDKHDLDGDVGWNPAKYINHSCTPNCSAEDIDGHIWIVAERRIKLGEELTFNYGYELEDLYDHPCMCGSPNCIGYMVAEEYFDEVKKRLAKTAVSR